MTGPELLLVATLITPLIMLIACLSPAVRSRMPELLALAPVPALFAALFAHDNTMVAFPAPFSITLALDPAAAILFGAVALLWIAAGFYASDYLRGNSNSGAFSAWWLLTLIGNLGVFIAADLTSFYLVFAIVSLSAYSLIVFDGTPRARQAGFVYIALGMLGEAALLLGFVRLALGTTSDSLLIRDAVAALPASPWRDSTLALLMVGFGLKIGLAPLHVWIPLAHSAAPLPVSVVLSGAVVKSGVIGLIRFLPFEFALPEWGGALAAAGLFTALYGVAVGLTQSHPKTVLAYSTMSQMGVVAAVIGMGLAAGDANAAFGASFYAAHHVLAKGALFFAVGVVAATANSSHAWPALLLAAIAGLSLGGLPLTGGALAKSVAKAQLENGVVGTLATISAIGTTVLMIHFLRRLMLTASHDLQAAPPARLAGAWLATTLASVAVPWLLFPSIPGDSFSDVLSAKGFWAALWPVLAGCVLALALKDWQRYLPRLPEGDIAAFGEGAPRLAVRASAVIERVDAHLRNWPIAGVSLLALTAILGMAMVA